jgi:hypothetical protein
VSTRAGEQRVGFLLSSATLDRPASSLRRAGRDAEPSHHHRRSGCRPHHHIPGATELLVASHFFLAVAPFVYPELLPDVPESAAVERHRRLPDAYTGEPPPSFLPLQCATHRVASRRRCAARAGRCRCATVGRLDLRRYCVPRPLGYCSAEPRAEVGPLAFKFFFYFF